LGYWGEQNGQSVLGVAAGYRLLQNQNRIVRVGGSIRCPATKGIRFPAPNCDFVRFRAIVVALVPLYEEIRTTVLPSAARLCLASFDKLVATMRAEVP
jgi:hypothetical protein